MAGNMTTTFTADNMRCGHKTKIVAELMQGGRISVKISSSCKDVQRYAGALTEVQIRDIAKKILENPVYSTASPYVGPECPVPCAVVSAVWTEAGLVSKNLLRKYDTIAIKYIDAPAP